MDMIKYKDKMEIIIFCSLLGSGGCYVTGLSMVVKEIDGQSTDRLPTHVPST